MPDHVIPEIKRTSLTSVVLTLKCLAIHDVIRYVGNLERNVAGVEETLLCFRNHFYFLTNVSLGIETNLFPEFLLLLVAIKLNQKY